MKIVVIAGYTPSLINFRGPLLAALVKDGHEVTACAPEYDDKVCRELCQLGVKFIKVPGNRTGINPFCDIAYAYRLYRLMRCICPGLVLGYTIKPVIFGSIAAKCARVPAIASMITGLGYAFLGRGFKGRIVNYIVTFMYRVALRFNNTVFFQNPDDLALFVNQRLVESSKTRLINGSGVDINYFSPAPLGTAPVFLMIARLLYDKGVREYVAAACLLKKRYPHAVFRLLGPLDTNPASVRKIELEKWLEDGSLQYLGVTDDIRPVMAEAAVYVLPSYREGTPRTVLEAMAMGRPVVTTDAPGCRETVVDGVNGFLVPVKDVDALAEAMERFVLKPELINEMGKSSRQRAEDNYDVRKVNASIIHGLRLQNETTL